MTEAQQVPEDAGDGMGFEDVDADVSVITHGDPIRSTMDLPTVLVDEAKFRFTADGLSIQAVDPANVGMVDLDIHADGFSVYDFDADRDEVVAGVPFDTLTNALGFARKRGGNGDPVRIDVLDADGDVPRMRVSVQRPDQQMKRVSVFALIDPDSIRQEPDIPDLDLPFRATPGIEPLRDAIRSLKAGHDHSWFAIDDGDLVLGSQPTPNPTLDGDDVVTDTVVFPNAAWAVDEADLNVGDGQGSLFSMDYLRDMTQALKTSKMERVTLHFGIEFPVLMDWDHPDWNVSGQFMLAPRIQSDD